MNHCLSAILVEMDHLCFREPIQQEIREASSVTFLPARAGAEQNDAFHSFYLEDLERLCYPRFLVGQHKGLYG